LAHRADTAFLASAVRSAGVKFILLFLPPLRPSDTAAGSFCGAFDRNGTASGEFGA
jgi:hypothetical protein